MNSTVELIGSHNSDEFVAEVAALGTVLGALAKLDMKGREFVLRTAWGRFGFDQKGPGQAAANEVAPVIPTTQNTQPSDEAPSPKQFFADRRPSNDVQRVACLAYYLTHHRKQLHFKTADITALNIEAAQRAIGNAAQAVANATSISGYLAVAGEGKKQITALGDKVVEALPDQDTVRKAISELAPTRTRGARKTQAKKPKRRG